MPRGRFLLPFDGQPDRVSDGLTGAIGKFLVYPNIAINRSVDDIAERDNVSVACRALIASGSSAIGQHRAWAKFQTGKIPDKTRRGEGR